MNIPLFLSYTIGFAVLQSAWASQSLTVNNRLGIAYAEQIVEQPLPQAEPSPSSVAVFDDQGRIAGQVSKDGLRAILRAGFGDRARSRTYTVGSASDRAAGVLNPVQIAARALTASDTPAAVANGISHYYEITNGLIGLRVPVSMKAEALPGSVAPAPVVGVRFKDGEWSGRPDFRALMVPLTNVVSGTAETWSFTGLESEIIENGPFQTTVRVSYLTTRRTQPYIYEITLYANERFAKVAQKSGRLNDWLIDLNLFKPTAWRPNRWRTGANHHWENTTATLPDRPDTAHTLQWPDGPGPRRAGGAIEYLGEGEGNLFSRDVWAEFAGDTWGRQYLFFKAGDSGALAKHMLTLRGISPWWPWGGVGKIMYAHDSSGGDTSPVVGLMAGPAGEVTDWNPGGDPAGEVSFTQHIPAWTDGLSAADGWLPYGTGAYLKNWNYQGVADRAQAVFTVKVINRYTSGSFFLWIGENRDIIRDIADPRYTESYISPIWSDWARYASGGLGLSDAQNYRSDWSDPVDAGGSWVEPEIVAKNRALITSSDAYYGNYGFLGFWRAGSASTQRAAVQSFLDQRLTALPPENRFAPSLLGKIERSLAGDYTSDGNLQFYTFEREVGYALDDISTYFQAGRASQGGLLSDTEWDRLKLVTSFYLTHVFDEDRISYWNEGVTVSHGGGTMTSNINAARFSAIVRFADVWPGLERFSDRIIGSTSEALLSQVGRYGAQFTSTQYSSLAGITPMLADLQSLQYKSYAQPERFPDEFARDPRLRHHAYFILNRMGVRDPRNGNDRMPVAMGDAGPGWGHPAAALLSSAFRHLDPALSKQLLWAWVVNGRSHNLQPPLPLILDYQGGQQPYFFPKLANFPGNLVVHRTAPLTENETGVWVTNGGFFNQHREACENLQVHIDALGKPLVTSYISYAFPPANNALFRNVVAPLRPTWDSAAYDGTYDEPWNTGADRVIATGELAHGSYSKSATSGHSAATGDWTRAVTQLAVDPDVPLILVRDTLSRSRDYMSTFWLQTGGAITVPGGAEVTPEFREALTVYPGPGPSATSVGNLPAGVSRFTFRGHDWINLYKNTYQSRGVTDVGPLVDTDIYVATDDAAAAVVGQWRTTDLNSANRPGEQFDDRQYLRVKFTGASHATLFTPFFRGRRPADLAVTRPSPGVILVRYTHASGARREITFTPDGCTVVGDGLATTEESYPARVDRQLYPESNDLPYGGQISTYGSSISTVSVSDGPAWARGDYEQVPPAYVANMLVDGSGVRNPFARYGPAAELDTSKPAYRATFGRRTLYLFALKARGYHLAPLPGASDDPWLRADLPSPNPVASAGWRAFSADEAIAGGGATVANLRFDWANSISHETIPQTPAAPLALSADLQTATSITLSWRDVANTETAYRLERDKNPEFTSPTSITLAADTSTHTDTDLAKETTYHYRLRALNDAGASAYSNTVTIETASFFGGATLLSDLTPSGIRYTDPDDNELGVRFQTDEPGVISAIRVWRPLGGPASYTARLWRATSAATGVELARLGIAAPATDAWAEAALNPPVPVVPGQTYIVSYTSPRQTSYLSLANGLATARGAPPLRTLASPNGVYATASGLFPAASYQSSNYWVDVRYSPSAWAWWNEQNLARLDPALRRAAADPDADGLANLLEYALGHAPLAADASDAFTLGTAPDGRLSLAFYRARAELVYTVQGSADLQTWADLQSYGPAADPTVFTPTDTLFTDSVAMPARRFLRLKVTAP